MEERLISQVDILKVGTGIEEVEDLLVVEEPLEIRLFITHNSLNQEIQLSVTMRTPGHDFELALGFLFTEGIIKTIADVKTIRYCEQVKESEQGNVIKVSLNEHVDWIGEAYQRNFYTTSSCGVCGKSAIEAIHTISELSKIKSKMQLNKARIYALSEQVLSNQLLFKHTGGIHAAALFDQNYKLLLLREDVGRHNAVDKVIGASLKLHAESLNNCLLFVSGRAGFELVQKAILAGIGNFVSVGAPSNLAVNLAKDYGMNLIGFLKRDKFNVYNSNTAIT